MKRHGHLEPFEIKHGIFIKSKWKLEHNSKIPSFQSLLSDSKRLFDEKEELNPYKIAFKFQTFAKSLSIVFLSKTFVCCFKLL